MDCLSRPPQAELHAREGPEPPVQAVAYLFRETIAGLAVQDGVKPLVLAEISIGVPRGHGGVAFRVRVVKLALRGIRDAGDGKTGADGLEHGHHVELFDEFHRARLPHEDAALQLQRLAHRRAGDAESPPQPNLVQPALPRRIRHANNAALPP